MSHLRRASIIVGVDINPDKFTLATSFGMTHSVNGSLPNLKEELLKIQPWGFDYTFGILQLINNCI
jgi:Zn-dependent alcohol dehydrogenase